MALAPNHNVEVELAGVRVSPLHNPVVLSIATEFAYRIC
jgi:hypothetical protein